MSDHTVDEGNLAPYRCHQNPGPPVYIDDSVPSGWCKICVSGTHGPSQDWTSMSKRGCEIITCVVYLLELVQGFLHQQYPSASSHRDMEKLLGVEVLLGRCACKGC